MSADNATRIVLVVDPSWSLAEVVAEALDLEVRQVDDLPGAARALATGEVGALVIGADIGFEEALLFTQQLPEQEAGVVLALDKRPSAKALRAALHAGVADVLAVADAAEEVRSAVDRAWREASPALPVPPPVAAVPSAEVGSIVTVFSAKGGCGKSTVAANLAVLLHQQGSSVCLVDLDLQFGDAAIMFQLTPSSTLHDVVQVLGDVDGDSIVDFLCQHESGVAILAAPLRPSQADDVTPAHIVQILTVLRSRYDHVVVDLPAAFTEIVLSAIDLSDRLVVLGSFDVPSIKNLRLGLTTLAQLGFDGDRVDVVMNRANAKVGLRLSEVERTLGTTIHVAIPSDREVTISLNHGIPIALEHPRSPVVQAIAELVARVLGTEAPPSHAKATATAVKERLIRRTARASATP